MKSKQLNPGLPPIYNDRNSVLNVQIPSVPTLECQHRPSLSPDSQQSAPFEIDDNFLALLDKEPMESLMPNRSVEELIAYLTENSGFITDPQTFATEQSTNSSNTSPPFYQTLSPRDGELPTETPTINEALLAQNCMGDQSPSYYYQSFLDQLHGCQSPIIMMPSPNSMADSSRCQPCSNENPMQNRPVPVLKLDQVESKIIQIICEPRSKYRPRTLNESQTSAHYIRCEDGAEHDHPAIKLPRFWMHQSRTNYIEVALVDTEKLLHPYDLRNKTSKSSFKDEALIVQQNQKNVLYFRLTNEDFVAGFKTFTLELIKGKQGDVITKKVIQARQLNQSRLRFTRLFVDGTGEIQHDTESVAYSTVLTENYGEVSVEHISPRFGLMNEGEMIFVLLKGRVLKEALTIVVSEPTTRYSHTVKNITLNGTVAYFSLQAWPRPRTNKMVIYISVYYQKELLQQSSYTYLDLPDQHLVGVDGLILPAIAKKSLQPNRPKRLGNKRKAF